MVERGAIAIMGVKFTQKEVHAKGGYFRLNAATKNKLGSCEDAEYGDYK